MEKKRRRIFTSDEIVSIFVQYKNGIKSDKLAEEFGVSTTTQITSICRIVENGLTGNQKTKYMRGPYKEALSFIKQNHPELVDKIRGYDSFKTMKVEEERKPEERMDKLEEAFNTFQKELLAYMEQEIEIQAEKKAQVYKEKLEEIKNANFVTSLRNKFENG